MASVLEHRERLAAVIDQYGLALELVPGERRIGTAGGEEEAVLLVDLGEVNDRRRLTLLKRPETLRRRRLAYVRRAGHDRVDRRCARRRDRVTRLESFLL